MTMPFGAQTLTQDELDISIDRVEKLDAPLLVIGLGGTGARAVHTIKRTFAQRFVLPVDANGQQIPVPNRTAYLVIDSDLYSRGELSGDEFLDIRVPGFDFNHRDTRPWEDEWLDKCLAPGKSPGVVRQMGRLLLSRHYDDVLCSIASKLTAISRVTYGGSNTVNIVIVCGISGGTGSGTFLDVAQIVRHIMQTNVALVGYQFGITGFLVMPDVLCQALPAGQPIIPALKANAYAALKELDFWMGYGSKHEAAYTMQYTSSPDSRIEWTKPFSDCTLLCGTTYTGTAYAHADRVVFDTIAETLFSYMAKENNGVDPTTGLPQHTYISYEDNLRAVVARMQKHLPVNYVYRSIGTYTKKIPKKSIIYYESNKLFQTFMPPRDAAGNIIPSMTLIDAGQCGSDAATIVEAPAVIYQRFAGALPLPGFCDVDVSNPSQVESLCNMGIAPHDSANVGDAPWQKSALSPAARQSAEDFLNQIWTSFMADIRNKISNPKIGPFALKEYLDPAQAQSLRSTFQSKLAEWVGLRKNFQGSVAHLYTACANTWSQFVNPPFMGQRRARQEYMDNLRRYFDMLRCAAFMEAHVSALEKFIWRVDDYRNTSLVQLCHAMDELDKEFAEGGIANTDTASDLFDLASIQPQLDASFAARNANDEIGRAFLTQLADVSLAAVPNSDALSGGLSFTFASTRLSSIRAALREQLENCFGDVNNTSMDEFLEQQAGGDPGRLSAIILAFANAMIASSTPLFSVIPMMEREDKVKLVYLSVPENSPNLFNHLYEMFPDAVIKTSAALDRITCIVTYDGLPLCRYSKMPELKEAYAAALTSSLRSTGLHLVQSGDLRDGVKHNWFRLPSPSPDFLFSDEGQTIEINAFEAAKATLDRAIACGVISIDDSTPNPSYTLRIKYTDGVPKSSDLIRREVDSILESREPETDVPLPDAEILTHLLQYQSEAKVYTISNTCNPSCMQRYLGLRGQPCDPFTPASQENPETTEQAMKNHRELCRALAAAYLYGEPITWFSIENQLEGMEYLQECISKIDN